MRRMSPLDLCIDQADQWLRHLSGTAPHRVRPDVLIAESPLSDAEREEAGRLMRVNHSGEVAAQALYQGQSMTTRSETLRAALHRAAREEGDHLAWTGVRLTELSSRSSYLNPLWYAGALAIGITAGAAGDAWNLGFIAETERQVVEHLGDQIRRLPVNDEKSRTILSQMRTDEAIHATTAMESGGRILPLVIREGMRLAARVMVRTAYWI